MEDPRPSNRLAIGILLALVAAMLGGLMLGVAGDRKGMLALSGADTRVALLTDPVAGLRLEDVLARPEGEWRPWDGRGYVQSLHGEAVWVRIVLRNPGAEPRRGVLADAEYYTDRIEAWVLADDGNWDPARTGAWVPAAERPLPGRDAAIPVEVPAHGGRTVILRVSDHFGAWMRLVWWPDERAFLAAQLRDTIAEAAYFGIMFALFVYNGVVWARLRFHDIGWYLGYLGSVAGFMFLARAQDQVAGWTLQSPLYETPVTVFIAASAFFFTRFAGAFLELDRLVPRAGWVVRQVGTANAVLACAGLVTPWMNNTILLHQAVAAAALTHAVLLAAAIVAWRAGAYYARFFVLSFGLLLAGMLPAAVIWLLAIPLGQSVVAMMLGSALEMLMLSLAIADRFARLQRERIAAQAQAVAEAEKRQAVQEAYADELEHEVRARSRELAAANADKDRMMAVLGHDLRGPLTALTLSAEQVGAAMAGAGARAGFAQEAAQTGRALLLLLEDVVLWARLRAGTVRTAAHAAAGVVSPAVELHRAAAVRRGVDLVVEAAPGLRIQADLVPVQALVRNLVARAMKSAVRRVEVILAAAPSGGVRIVVRDDGPAPEEESGGLGLRLCAEIAQAMQTTLDVSVLPGGGTEAGFTLPPAGGPGPNP